MRSAASFVERVLVERLDHDALAGAFLGGLHDDVDLIIGDAGNAAGAFGTVAVAFFPVENEVRSKVARGFTHNPQPVVATDKHVGSYLFTDSITGAEILIDPHHQFRISHGLNRSSNAGPTR